MKKNKKRLGYFCPYIPLNYFVDYGIEMVSLYHCDLETYPVNGILNNNLCSIVLKAAEAVQLLQLDGIIITNCCNSMQRLFDYCKVHYRSKLKVYMMEIPRRSNGDVFFLNEQNTQVIKNIFCDFDIISKRRDVPCFKFKWIKFNMKQVFQKKVIYIIGNTFPRIIERMIEGITYNYEILYHNCMHNRDVLSIFGFKNSDEVVLPCFHMQDYTEWFNDIICINKSEIAAIIYVSSTNCDVSVLRFKEIYDVAKKMNIPNLHLDVSYAHSGYGQLQTRLEAFLEQINYGVNNQKHFENSINRSNNGKSFFQQRIKFAVDIQHSLRIEAVKELITYQIDLFTKKISVESDKIIWTNMAMPLEIFYAMDLIPIHIELVSGWLASLGLSREYILRAESNGVGSAICSYHKAVLGLMLSEEVFRPNKICISSNICDGSFGLAKYCKNKFGSQIFFINVPYYENESSISYVSNQLDSMLCWLKNEYDISFIDDRLKQACILSNDARRGWIETNKMRKIATGYPGRLSIRNLFGMTFLFGSRLGVSLVETYKSDLKHLVDKKDNKYRKPGINIFWIHFSPLYDNSIVEYAEEKLKLRIITDIVSYIYWDKYDIDVPLNSIAKRMLSHFYMGNVEKRLNAYSKLIKEYNIHGIIHYIHHGCRPIAGSSWIIRDLANKMNIPYLELSGDCIDPRGGSHEQMIIRLEAFRESIGGE